MAVWGQIEHELGLMLLLAVALVIAYVLRRFGVLPFSPTENAAVERANRAENELKKAHERIGTLEQTRSMRPILELQRETTALVSTVVDKLTSFNGSLKAINESLDETHSGLTETREALTVTVEALKLVAGLVVGANELEPGPRARPRSS